MIVVLRWHPPKRCSLHIPRTLLSRQQSPPLSPLPATLMKSPTSVANKRLTRLLSPLAATLTKNRGEVGVMVNQIPVGFNVPTCRRSDVSTFQRSVESPTDRDSRSPTPGFWLSTSHQPAPTLSGSRITSHCLFNPMPEPSSAHSAAGANSASQC